MNVDSHAVSGGAILVVLVRLEPRIVREGPRDVSVALDAEVHHPLDGPVTANRREVGVVARGGASTAEREEEGDELHVRHDD